MAEKQGSGGSWKLVKSVSKELWSAESKAAGDPTESALCVWHCLVVGPLERAVSGEGESRRRL